MGARFYKEEGSYFYLEEKDHKWVFHTKDHPKMKYTFRKEFVRLTGLHGLTDWRTMSNKEKERNREWVEKTKDVLRI